MGTNAFLLLTSPCVVICIRWHANAAMRKDELYKPGKERGERCQWQGNHHAYSPGAIEYVRLLRATVADPGDDAGRAVTARAAAAEAEGSEASRRSACLRNTGCA